MENDLVPLQYRYRPACDKVTLTKSMIGKQEEVYTQLVIMDAWKPERSCQAQPDWVKPSKPIAGYGEENGAGLELK